MAGRRHMLRCKCARFCQPVGQVQHVVFIILWLRQLIVKLLILYYMAFIAFDELC